MRSLITVRYMEQKRCLLLLEIFFASLSKCILFLTLPAPTLMSAVHLAAPLGAMLQSMLHD